MEEPFGFDQTDPSVRFGPESNVSQRIWRSFDNTIASLELATRLADSLEFALQDRDQRPRVQQHRPAMPNPARAIAFSIPGRSARVSGQPVLRKRRVQTAVCCSYSVPGTISGNGAQSPSDTWLWQARG